MRNECPEYIFPSPDHVHANSTVRKVFRDMYEALKKVNCSDFLPWINQEFIATHAFYILNNNTATIDRITVIRSNGIQYTDTTYSYTLNDNRNTRDCVRSARSNPCGYGFERAESILLGNIQDYVCRNM